MSNNELEKRVIDRMESMNDLILIRDKVVDCSARMQDILESESGNKILTKAVRKLLPQTEDLLIQIGAHLIEIMLDGDPRYYPDEEE